MEAGSLEVEGTAVMEQRGVGWGAFISPVVAALVWELLVMAGILHPSYLPPPSQLGPHLVELLAAGELGLHLWVTLYRLGLSFVLAVVPALVLGLSLGMSRNMRLALEPILTSLYAIPKIALLPLIMLIVGVNERALIFTSTLTSFVQMTVSTTGGVLAVDRIVLEAGKNYGATGWRLFRYVLLPSALPDIFTGMRIGLGLTLVLVIAVELTAAQEGLGAFLWTAGQTLSAKNLFSAFVVIGVIGWALTYGLERIGNWLMPWRERSSAEMFL
jgi:NitT/TauT family transport system permease protein